MNTYDLDSSHPLFRTAAWMWLGYLALLLATDLSLSAAPFQALERYYLVNGLVALLFLTCAYWPGLQRRLQHLYTPLLLSLIAAVPVIVNRVWVGPLPPGPMSNVEGLTLRLLPVLFIGLVITAWQYPWPVVAFYAVATALLEIGVHLMLPGDISAGGNPDPIFVITFVAVVRSVSFLVVGYFISRLIRQLRTQHNRLVQANARLVDYATTLEQLTLSRERNRLARELHDTLAHSLSALSVQLETVKAYWGVEPETARELLEQSLTTTRTGLNETRRALKSLRASPLEDLGLALALRKLAEQAAERGRFILHLDLPEQLPHLEPTAEQCIYRVAQEALENVVRHARARNLYVALTNENGSIALSIRDDGVGFEPQAVQENGHFGLAGMRERAAMANAKLEIAGRPGQGTHIRLIFKERPYTHESADL